MRNQDPLFFAFQQHSQAHGFNKSVLVIDNLESIFKREDLMEELADIVNLLDDAKFAKFNIKLLIVGIPNGVLDYFAKTKNMEAVANRIEELPKVNSLTVAQTRSLVTKGFNELLKYGFSREQIEEITLHVHHITMGVAQRMHEYCAKFAKAFEDNGMRYLPTIFSDADRKWLIVGLRASYTVIESHFNSRKTTIARRNQIIYCVGKIDTHQFAVDDIREGHFYKSP